MVRSSKQTDGNFLHAMNYLLVKTSYGKVLTTITIKTVIMEILNTKELKTLFNQLLWYKDLGLRHQFTTGIAYIEARMTIPQQLKK